MTIVDLLRKIGSEYPDLEERDREHLPDILSTAAQVMENITKEKIQYEVLYKQAQKKISEQNSVVRCKDCRFWKDQSTSMRWLPCIEAQTDRNWFCGSGMK